MKGFALSRKRFETDEKWPMIPLYSARGIWAGGRDVRNHNYVLTLQLRAMLYLFFKRLEMTISSVKAFTVVVLLTGAWISASASEVIFQGKYQPRSKSLQVG